MIFQPSTAWHDNFFDCKICNFCVFSTQVCGKDNKKFKNWLLGVSRGAEIGSGKFTYKGLADASAQDAADALSEKLVKV
jgi:hypothetical protein